MMPPGEAPAYLNLLVRRFCIVVDTNPRKISAMRPQVRFCAASDGVRLAYAISGNGPPLVRAPHWFTHLEHDVTNPAMRPWVEHLSQRYSFLRFDQRGTGLSDRDVPEISFDANLRDLGSVVDAAGLDRFGLLGLSQGATYAIAYAARHPERVSHLIICGGFARGWAKRGQSAELQEPREMLVKLIEFGWGSDDPSFRQVFTTQFMPDAPLETIRAFNDMIPLTASASTAANIFRMHGSVDVQAEARQVRCPTLVLHGRGELRIPYEEGRIIAGLVAGSRFVTLETRNHLMTQDEPAWRELLGAIDAFYPGTGAGANIEAFSGLTVRQREVLELVAQGLDNAQIAARLDLSEKTVRNSMTQIFDKIGVENRAQAIVLAIERGLGRR